MCSLCESGYVIDLQARLLQIHINYCELNHATHVNHSASRESYPLYVIVYAPCVTLWRKFNDICYVYILLYVVSPLEFGKCLSFMQIREYWTDVVRSEQV